MMVKNPRCRSSNFGSIGDDRHSNYPVDNSIHDNRRDLDSSSKVDAISIIVLGDNYNSTTIEQNSITADTYSKASPSIPPIDSSMFTDDLISSLQGHSIKNDLNLYLNETNLADNPQTT